MMFSQRIGVTPLLKEIQLETIDEELKNGLWNIYDINILKNAKDERDEPNSFFTLSLWHHYFKKPVDTIPHYYKYVREEIRDYFFSCKWFEVYDFLEFNCNLLGKGNFINYIRKEPLLENFNQILEREFAGYRFINQSLSPISNTTEIKEIEDSLSSTNSFTALKSCNTHLQSALMKLSDRLNPDYRNSIKESISAVESLAKIISGNSKDTLAGAIDKIKGKIKIHAALERGFKQIYGYTSDSGGIRHSLTEETTCDFEDAKFMMVSCSAFINYLIAKAGKAGIEFS